MSTIRIDPCRRLRGEVSVSGDKSVSHRLAMLAAIAEGRTRIRNYSMSADCQSTLRCLKDLGVEVSLEAMNQVTLSGLGLGGLHPPAAKLDVGNSGSTLRMLSGLLAGHSFHSELMGDESIRRRPMKRIMDPLSQMGARFEARDGEFPPLKIAGTRLRGIRYSLPLPSAQVKTAILFAGLLAEGHTEVIESIPSRNHTEIALQEFGAEIKFNRHCISVQGGKTLRAGEFIVPGDPSSAAFLVAAALLVPDSEILVQSVGLNPTRIAFFNVLKSMGADIQYMNHRDINGEKTGDVRARSSRLGGGTITASMLPQLIDEIPMMAVLGAKSQTGLSVRGARELRVKESDRIGSIVKNLQALGASVQEFPDGFFVAGHQHLKGANLLSFGDHRIAMAFTIAALVAAGSSSLDNTDCVNISFPTFFEALNTLQT